MAFKQRLEGDKDFWERGLQIEDLKKFIPRGVTDIVSGGAKGIDSQAAQYAILNNIPLKEFLPEYSKYGKYAPLRRNKEIAEYSDMALAFWDGTSKGTMHTISLFKSLGKEVLIFKF